MKEAFLGLVLLAALPSTSAYKLNSYGFGSGGTAKSSTTSYSIEGSSGELSGQASSTATSTTKPGFVQTEQANVPKLTSLDNGSGLYYNKLHFVLDSQNNPTDATYLLAVSTDNFASNVTYLQPDGTLSSSLSTGDYQTYAGWGGASGSYIIGLLPGTTYYVKVRATQGNFTESAYGPISSQATAAPTLSFDLNVYNPSNSSTTEAPTTVDFGTLSGGSIASTSQTIDTSLTTNAAAGGNIYIGSQNSGLLSSSTSSKIDSVSSDLTSTSEGYGAQISSVNAPLTGQSPYNSSGNIVGLVPTTLSSLYSATSPMATPDTAALILKAKANTSTVAASDYQEVLTFAAAGNF